MVTHVGTGMIKRFDFRLLAVTPGDVTRLTGRSALAGAATRGFYPSRV